ncbi:MAG: dienelactone hydrolase family protein [Syntrophorhabdaceae bacterium]|nr:dienelactone hydrolase family protein [Syntrophorhabdaceae bacterium]
MRSISLFASIAIIILAISIPSFSFAADEGKLLEGKIDGVTVLVYIPKGWVIEKKYPLIIGCHGGGQTGREIYNAWHRAADERGYIIAAPTFGDFFKQKNRKLDEFILNIVKEMRSTYRIDSTRIVMVGNSMGASCTYWVGLMHPEVITAIAPCSGYSPYLKGFPWKPGLKKIPVYILHGEKDPYAPLEEMYKEEAKLKSCGYDVKVHVNKGIGHAYPNALETPVPDWIDSHFK